MHAATLVDMFGEELEADFHEVFHLDLLDWFRGVHMWGKLVRLANQLPRHSRYVAAMYEDESIALQILARGESEDTPTLTLADWTHERELLTVLIERVASLEATLVGVNSKNGKRPDPPSLPRPRTAVDRMRYRQNRSEAASIAELFRPKGT